MFEPPSSGLKQDTLVYVRISWIHFLQNERFFGLQPLKFSDLFVGGGEALGSNLLLPAFVDLVIFDGVAAEVRDRLRLPTRQLQFLEEATHSLQIHNCVQINLGMELFTGNSPLVLQLPAF